MKQAINISNMRHPVTQEHNTTKLYTVSNDKYS